MKPHENSKDIPKTLWPGTRAALRRLLLITLTLFPLSWAVFALIVGDWKLNMTEGTEESARHFKEWMVVLTAAISVVFLASLLPLGRWLFSGRVVRRTLIVMGWSATAVIVMGWSATAVALFYAVEDWRGRHSWNDYRRQLEAGGARLDYAAFIPKPIPDEQNFAATPVVKSWFVEVDRSVFTNTSQRFANRWDDNFEQAKAWIPASKDKGSRHFTDLVAWKMAFDAIRSGDTNSPPQFESGALERESRAAAVPGVLEGLKTDEAVLAELRNASQRPYSRYPVVYDLDNPWGILLPHVRNVKEACQRLQLRACAELAVARSEAALADVKLSLYLADSLNTEPFLISYLVRIACLQIAIQPVWEGLAEHAWSDAQLQELQGRLERYELITDLNRALEGERSAVVMTADLLARGKYHLNELTSDPSPLGSTLADVFGRVAPRGWYHQEQLSYCRLFQLQMGTALDTGRKQILPAQLASNSVAVDQAFAGRNPVTTLCTRHQLLAVMMLPALRGIPLKAAATQTTADQVALACMLERYRLAEGQFPESLQSLVPRFVSQLPRDVISGGAFKYRRTPDGQCSLYSVGWNEQDDGGIPGKTLFDDKQGDWVWQLPK